VERQFAKAGTSRLRDGNQASRSRKRASTRRAPLPKSRSSIQHRIRRRHESDRELSATMNQALQRAVCWILRIVLFAAFSGTAALAQPAAGGTPASASRARAEHGAVINVEFLADGRCVVSVKGDESRPDPMAGAPGRSSPTSEYRCAMPSAPRGRPVELTVILPGDETPSGAGFPRLAWAERDRRWIGTASLPAAPAFVRLPKSGSSAARRARLLDATALAATVVAIVWTIIFTVRNRTDS
jgi:hypothetical protein